ncbi:hypothetical protein GGI25_004390 [Coemansia spiralis]|uniref:Uncharacterized protein n=1 Tax=Coemansia spiralis TaxID=417178 RepID=A0A9W8KX84_9FUNG|nr:hypothetical protein BX070DRAFT_223811 [Coemansia spiralis]KAJ2674369.1 hypothetical protein GGI25_004390 [Coemansia spiralis]
MKLSAITFIIFGAALAPALPLNSDSTKLSVGGKDDAHPCNTHTCQQNEVCVEEIVQCFAAPCNPLPSCKAA